MSTASLPTLGAVERLADAVLMAEAKIAAGAPGNPYQAAARDVYLADAAYVQERADTVTNTVLAAMVTAASTGGSELNAAVHAAAALVGDSIVSEIQPAMGLVLLLAQTLADRSGVTVGEVLRECVDGLRAVASE